MSTGTLLQINSKGIQNKHLDLKSEVTLWRRSYRRPTPFAIERLDLGLPNLQFGKQYTFSMHKHGDLLSDLHLVIDLYPLKEKGITEAKELSRFFTKSLGNAMIEHISFTVGQQVIDYHTAESLEIKHLVSRDVNKNDDILVLRSDDDEQLKQWSFDGTTVDAYDGNPVVRLYTRIPFYFTEANSQAFPILNCLYAPLNLRLQLRRKEDLLVRDPNLTPGEFLTGADGSIKNAHFMLTTVFLDKPEREMFLENLNETLIKNRQIYDSTIKPEGATRLKVSLPFNHPIVCKYWFIRRIEAKEENRYFDWSRTKGENDDTFTSCTLLLNNSTRESPRDPLFWKYLTTTGLPTRPNCSLYFYSYADAPLGWFPSGVCNYSRFEDIDLEFRFPQYEKDGVTKYKEAEVFVMAEHFNVMRNNTGTVTIRYAT